MLKISQAQMIKISAVITAAPRWVIALLAAEGFALPDGWLKWWVIVSAGLSLGMAVVEGFAFSFIFNAWRIQKDKAADKLLWLAVASAVVFVAVMTPSIAAGVRGVPLGVLLKNDWALYGWSMFVSLSTIVIVAGVGYAEKQTGHETERPARSGAASEKANQSESLKASAPAKSELENNPLPVLVALPKTENGHQAHVCPFCEREFKTKNALNPHLSKCKAKFEQSRSN